MRKKRTFKGGKKEKRAQKSSNGNGGVKKQRSVPTYAAAQSILILGDGDFSFSAGLVKNAGMGENVVATSLDTRAECVKKYGAVVDTCINACEKAGVSVKHSVDATALQNKFEPDSFHFCIFNFPHTGEQRVHSNQAMLHAFFKSARPLLKLGGEIHITIKLAPPYSEWDVPSIAQAEGYVKWQVRPFDFAQFPGYKHRTTLADAKALDTSSKGAAGTVNGKLNQSVDGKRNASSALQQRDSGVQKRKSKQSHQPARNKKKQNKLRAQVARK